MTGLVPGPVAVLRKSRFLLPEISASRLAFATSGSFRPKLGLAILAIVVVSFIGLILFTFAPTPSSFLGAAMLSNEEAVKIVASANEKFVGRFQNKVGEEHPHGNLIMSPYSVSSVLSMALNGAGGQTKDQIVAGLALDGSADEQGRGHGIIVVALKSNDNFTLNAANRIYVSTSEKFNPSYVEVTKANFLVEPVATDFSKAEESRTAINTWVETQTNNRIKDLIKAGVLNSATRMVLVNAVYFKGLWAHQFDAMHTTKQDFHVDPNTTVKVDMMRLTASFAIANDFAGLSGTMALEIPYKGDRLSMVIILPAKNETVRDLETRMAGLENLQEAFNMGGKHKVKVSLPRFKVESDLDLNGPLKAMGMVDMFDKAKADFSAMKADGQSNLYVSDVVQKAFVEVNEEGTEAAAATAGIVMMRAMAINPIFTCDRPFIFVIRDKMTGLTLFSGRIMDPTK